MPRTFDQILEGFTALKVSDFDYRPGGIDGLKRLKELTDELMTLPQPERGVRTLFDVMERMDGCDLGSPGPLVHTLERMRGCYEGQLAESIKRKPTPLAIWMVNRILNGKPIPEHRQFFLELLRFASEHPTAPQATKEEAREFIQLQTQAA
jgi:hypothetical protein